MNHYGQIISGCRLFTGMVSGCRLFTGMVQKWRGRERYGLMRVGIEEGRG